MRTIVICLLLLSIRFTAHADASGPDSLVIEADSIILIAAADSNNNFFAIDSAASPRRENKRVIAAVLAFPFPFGLLGLHRIYLGTKPYMPFVYLGTLGGCLGILPLIDFIAIVSSKGKTLKTFENNPKVFMWSR